MVGGVGMIPARIISISDNKVMIEYEKETSLTYVKDIAEVENVEKGKMFQRYKWFYTGDFSPQLLFINQTIFIEPISEGKCKIVKI